MTKPFTKLFSSIITSSIWNENDKVRVLWITMLALADRTGHVCASMGGLAHAARISKDDCEAALGYLLSPDDDSRSIEYEGRRIDIVDGGYQILNYTKYRELGKRIDRTEYLAAKQRESRARKRQQRSTAVNTASTIPSASASLSASEKKEGESEGKKKPAGRKDVLEFARSIGLPETDGHYYFDHWEGNGYKNAGKAIKDWKATIRSHKHAGHCPSQKRMAPSAFQRNWKDRDKERGRLQEEKNQMFRLKQKEHREFTAEEQEQYDELARKLEELSQQ